MRGEGLEPLLFGVLPPFGVPPPKLPAHKGGESCDCLSIRCILCNIRLWVCDLSTSSCVVLLPRGTQDKEIRSSQLTLILLPAQKGGESCDCLRKGRWRSNASGKYSQERLTRGTVTSIMRRAARPSGCNVGWWGVCDRQAPGVAFQQPNPLDSQRFTTPGTHSPKPGPRTSFN